MITKRNCGGQRHETKKPLLSGFLCSEWSPDGALARQGFL